MIIVDAYRPPYVPFYLATKEFFELVRERLRPGGIVALNVATTPDDHDLAENIGGTLATVLPRAFAWQPLRFNQIVIGQDGEPTGRRARRRRPRSNRSWRTSARTSGRSGRRATRGRTTARRSSGSPTG